MAQGPPRVHACVEGAVVRWNEHPLPSQIGDSSTLASGSWLTTACTVPAYPRGAPEIARTCREVRRGESVQRLGGTAVHALPVLPLPNAWLRLAARLRALFVRAAALLQRPKHQVESNTDSDDGRLLDRPSRI